MERRVTKQGRRSRVVASCASLLVLAAHGCMLATSEEEQPDESPAQAGAPSAGNCCDVGGTASDPAVPQGGSGVEQPGGPGAAGGDDEPMMGGSGAAGAPAADLDSVAGLLGDFGAPFKDSWVLHGCLERQIGHCKIVPNCPLNNAADFDDKGSTNLQTFPIGGVLGQNYKVTFTFNAVWGGTFYLEGERDQGEGKPADPENGEWDGFYRGGKAVPTSHGVLKLSVLDREGQRLRYYYLNSVLSIADEVFPTRRTYLFSYTKSIVVVGGGQVTYLMHAPSCNVVDNCGPGVNPDEGCAAPRLLPNEPEDVALPTLFKGPGNPSVRPTLELSPINETLTQPWHAQLGHLTVTAVEPTADPVTHDYFAD